MPPSVLNEDCLFYICQQLARQNDHRTLARVMLLSKTYFVVVAPVLYGCIFQPSAGEMMKSWSEVKSRKLAALLLVASGIVSRDRLVYDAGPNEDPAGSSNFRATKEVSTIDFDSDQCDTYTRFQNASLEQFARWCPQYSSPTTIAYHELLKHMDQNLFDKLPAELSFTVASPTFTSVFENERSKFWLRFAPLVHQLDVSHGWNQIIFDNPFALCGLKKVRGVQNLWDKAELFEPFVKSHVKMFPDQVRTFYIQSEQQFRLIEDMKATKLRGYCCNFYRQEYLANTSVLYSTLVSIKIVHGYDFSFMPENLGTVLRQCRNLESVKLVPSHKDKNREPRTRTQEFTTITNSFEWVEDEWRLQRSPLVPVRNLQLLMLDTPKLQSCLNGWRNTLEKVSFQLLKVDTTLSWEWALPRLISLELRGVVLDLPSLDLCPMLQTLKLHNVRGTRKKCWSAPSSLRVFHMEGGHTFYRFKFSCLGAMLSLQHVSWNCDESTAEFEQQAKRIYKIDMEGWNFDKLQEMELSKGPHKCWKDRLMPLAPNLKQFRVLYSKVKREFRPTVFSMSLLTDLVRNQNIELLDLRGTTINEWSTLQSDFHLLEVLCTVVEDGIIGVRRFEYLPNLKYLFLPTVYSWPKKCNRSLQRMVYQRPALKQIWVNNWHLSGEKETWQQLPSITIPTLSFPTTCADLQEMDHFSFPVVVTYFRDIYYNQSSYGNYVECFRLQCKTAESVAPMVEDVSLA